MKYPKIQTLYERDKEFKVTTDSFLKREEFNIPKKWLVTEKIHGTNIRIVLTEEGQIEFKGRTDNAEIPIFLLEFLQSKFKAEKLKEVFWESDKEPFEVILFGEGYGARIQKGGGKYIPDGVGFIIFDVFIKKWLNYKDVKDIAEKLDIPIVPYMGMKTIEEITELVKKGFDSKIAKEKYLAEGIVARTEPALLDGNGRRMMFKLKYKDFKR